MARKAGIGALLPLDLDGDGASPLFQQLYRQLRQAVLEGKLQTGARLPATRFLAAELGVSRTSVLAAYDQLASEGFLELRHRSGAFVAADLPIAPAPKLAPSAPKPLRLGIRARDAVGVGPIGVAPTNKRPWPGCFVSGAPDVSQFPFDLWSRLLARAWRDPDSALPIGGDPGGHPDLRAAIAHYLGEARGIVCDPNHVLVVSGIRQALDLTCRCCSIPATRCGWRTPAIPASAPSSPPTAPKWRAFRSTRRGWMSRPAAWRRARRGWCVAPSHQFPLGVALSLPRRLMLLEWAREAGAWVLEDDYDSEYRYAGRPLATLKSLDADHRVIYVGTLSKLLFPSLRLGYLVAPPQLAQAFRRLRSQLDDQPSMVAQPALAELFRSGHLAAHVRRMRQIYDLRQRAFLKAARRHLGGLIAFQAEESGLHLVGRIGRRLGGRPDKALAAAAGREGIVLSALSDYDLLGDGPQGLMFGYAAAPEDLVEPALRRLKEIWTG